MRNTCYYDTPKIMASNNLKATLPSKNNKRCLNRNGRRQEEKDPCNTLHWTPVERGHEQAQCPIADHKNVNIRRCLGRSQFPEPLNKELVHPNTEWIMRSDPGCGPANGANHYVTTTMADYIKREPCKERAATRAKLMWNFLLQKMSEQVFAEATKEPEIEPYTTSYDYFFNDPNFKFSDADDLENDVLLRESEFTHPVYIEQPVTFWQSKLRKNCPSYLASNQDPKTVDK